MYRNGSKHIENAGPEAGRNSDERMKQRRNGGCKNSGADGAWVEAKGPKNGRRVMEVRRRAEGAAQRRAERQSGGCGAERSGRNWDQRLGILTLSTWCAQAIEAGDGRSRERSRRHSHKSKQF